jgi:hypothetical protein
MPQSADFLVQNALKLTYEHLQVPKIFFGSLSLAMKGIQREGKGRGGKGKRRKGRGKDGGEEREGRSPNFFTRGCAPAADNV